MSQPLISMSRASIQAHCRMLNGWPRLAKIRYELGRTSEATESGVFAPNRPLASISKAHLHATRLAAGVAPPEISYHGLVCQPLKWKSRLSGGWVARRKKTRHIRRVLQYLEARRVPLYPTLVPESPPTHHLFCHLPPPFQPLRLLGLHIRAGGQLVFHPWRGSGKPQT